MPKGAKYGGRQKGTANKSANCVRELAAPYGKESLEYLASAMRDKNGKTSDRISSAKELLDRAYGRPPQAIIGGDENDKPIRVLHEADEQIIKRYLTQKGIVE